MTVNTSRKAYLLRIRGGYAQINRSRRVCTDCGRKTSIYTKDRGRFCTWCNIYGKPSNNPENTKEKKT